MEASARREGMDLMKMTRQLLHRCTFPAKLANSTHGILHLAVDARQACTCTQCDGLVGA